MQKSELELRCIRAQESSEVVIVDSPNLYFPPLHERPISNDNFMSALEVSNEFTLVNTDCLKITTSSPPRSCYLWKDLINFAPTPKQAYLLECWVYVLDTSLSGEEFYNQSKFYPRYIPKIGIGAPPLGSPTNEPYIMEVLKEWEGSQDTLGVWTKLQTIVWGIDTIPQIGMYLHWEAGAFKGRAPLQIWADGFTLRTYNIQGQFSQAILQDFKLDLDSSQEINLTYSDTNLSLSESSGGQFSKNITLLDTPNNHANLEYINTITDNYDSTPLKSILSIDTIPIIRGDLNVIEITLRRVLGYKSQDAYNVYLKSSARAWADRIESASLRNLPLDYQKVQVNAIADTFSNTANTHLAPTDNFLSSSYAVFAYWAYGDAHELDSVTPTININNLRPSFFIKPLITEIFKQAGYVATFEGFTASNEFAQLVLPYASDNFLQTRGYLKTYLEREARYAGREGVNYDPIAGLSLPYFGSGNIIIPIGLYPEPFAISHSKIVDNPNDEKWFEARTKGTYKFVVLVKSIIDTNILPESDPYTIFSDNTSFPINYPNIELLDDNPYFWALTPDKRGFICEIELELDQCEKVLIMADIGVVEWFTSANNVGFKANAFRVGWRKQTGEEDLNVMRIPYSGFLYQLPYTPPDPYTVLEESQGSTALNVYDEFKYFMPDTCVFQVCPNNHEIREGAISYLKMSEYLPEMSQKELLTSLSAMYDLLFLENGSEVKIITRQDFEQPTTNAVNWTYKTDLTEIVKKPTQSPAKFSFAYQDDDSDELLPKGYGNDTYVLKPTGENKEATNGNKFSATLVKKLSWLDGVPTSSKFGTNQRILRYFGLQAGGKTYIAHSCPLQKYQVSGYPKMSFEGLSYKTEGAITGLRARFWQKYIDAYSSGVTIEAYFVLSLLDIMSLDFAKLVEIDGFFYRLKTVSDFSASLDKKTKCVLQKVFQGKMSANEQDNLIMVGDANSNVVGDENFNTVGV